LGLEFLKQHRQRHSGGRMDVMQQEDSPALCFQSLHGPLHNGLRGDAPEPVVGDHIRTPGHQRLRRQVMIDRASPAQTRNSEKRRKCLRITQCGIDGGYTTLNLGFDPLQWQALESERMVLTMSADGMARVVNATDHGRILVRHPTNQEVGSLNALRGQRIKNDVAIGRQRAVIESQDDFMVVERQTLLVLHAANFAEFAWADGELSARTERVWIAWASVPPGRSAGDSPENKQNTNQTHLASDAYLISRLLAHHTAKGMPIYKIRHERSLKIPSHTLECDQFETLTVCDTV